MPTALPVVALVWLDDYHVGDPLFIQGLARGLGERDPESRRAILVHGGAERAERLLEARALPFKLEAGVPVSDSPQSHGIIERAYRESNKEIVSVMTEFGVPAVGIQGSDRGLLEAAADTVEARRIAWLEALTASGAVAVVSALANRQGVVCGVPTGRVVLTLARALTTFEPEVRILHGDHREMTRIAEGDRLKRLSASMTEADHLWTRSLVSGGFRVVLCDSRTVFAPDPDSRVPIFG